MRAASPGRFNATVTVNGITGDVHRQLWRGDQHRGQSGDGHWAWVERVGGPYLKVEGGAQLTVQGVTMGGNFAFEQTQEQQRQRIIRIGSRIELQSDQRWHDAGRALQWQRSFVITPQGPAGGFSISAVVTLRVRACRRPRRSGFQINTAATAINQTITVAGVGEHQQCSRRAVSASR